MKPSAAVHGGDGRPAGAALPLDPPCATPSCAVLQQKSVLPQLDVKLLFNVGSAHDPAGKEGLAALTAAMIAEAGSKALTIEQIRAALYPMAGSFTAACDKEMTTFTGVIHRDHWQRVPRHGAAAAARARVPRRTISTRLKDAQLNALTQDLRSNNEEELGKERLQTNIFRGTPYGHVALGTVAGHQRDHAGRCEAVREDDVHAGEPDARHQRRRAGRHAHDRAGGAGDAARGTGGAAKAAVHVARSPGIDVDILEKDTRATAISFGFPIDVTRAHPDFAALSVARAWLGEHRSRPAGSTSASARCAA